MNLSHLWIRRRTDWESSSNDIPRWRIRNTLYCMTNSLWTPAIAPTCNCCQEFGRTQMEQDSEVSTYFWLYSVLIVVALCCDKNDATKFFSFFVSKFLIRVVLTDKTSSVCYLRDFYIYFQSWKIHETSDFLLSVTFQSSAHQPLLNLPNYLIKAFFWPIIPINPVIKL